MMPEPSPAGEISLSSIPVALPEHILFRNLVILDADDRRDDFLCDLLLVSCPFTEVGVVVVLLSSTLAIVNAGVLPEAFKVT